MDAPAELMERAKELVRSLCARNLIRGDDIPAITLALHDEICGASLAMLAEVALRRNMTCRGDLDIAIKATGFELMKHLHARHKVKEAEMENDPVMTRKLSVATVMAQLAPSEPEDYSCPDI